MDFKGFQQTWGGRDWRVRPATPGDAAAVRALLVETWHAAYDALLGAEEVTAITDRWHAVSVLTRQIEDPGQRFLVVERNGAILGHAAASMGGDDDLRLSRLYVLPVWQGKGVGRDLLQAAIAGWPVAACVTLEVESRNKRAIRFYERQGFSVSGERIEDGRTTLSMRRALR